MEQAICDDILIQEDSVECRPEKVSASILDENVDIHLVRKYFSQDAWLVLQDVLKHKKKMTWVCSICQHDLHGKTSGPSVCCESCLSWFHFQCVGLVKLPKARNWFCRSCHASAVATPS